MPDWLVMMSKLAISSILIFCVFAHPLTVLVTVMSMVMVVVTAMMMVIVCSMVVMPIGFVVMCQRRCSDVPYHNSVGR